MSPHAHVHDDPHPGPAHEHHGSHDDRRIAWTFALTLGFMAVEVIGGWIAHSLALIADAGHMLTDSAALALAWYALRLARTPSDMRRSYGYQRATVLAAFVNGLVLIGAVVWIVVFLAFRYASVASLVAALALAPAAWLLGYPWPVIVLGVFAAVGVFALHRANLERLWRGEENRSTLWRRWLRKGASPSASL